MGYMSIWHWSIILIYLLVIGLPVSIILRRAGFSRAWAILSILPIVNLIGLWIFAFSKWPAVDDKRQ